LYPHYFNAEENLLYIGPVPDVSFYGVNEMGEEERDKFPAWYETQLSELFDKRRVLENIFQNDVTVLNKA